jgi:predicted phage terminase large subunit-like protein
MSQTATEPAKPVTVKLHPAQREFLTSPALFKAMVGGIGSGKSWVGSYDLIRRAKPGRLYMVVAPTFGMLSDSTFRGFLQLAGDLGVLDHEHVKKGAPPSVRLLTGSEVIFRSADEPDRLRGPNLSGVWLDEASLMPPDTYTVTIGRLREGGEQGWLTATFTPKGKAHWTFETFATGKPNTAMFRAKTADNPFLPATFSETTRAQYTSTLAAQELEGEFIDEGGGLFKRGWFDVVDAAPGNLTMVRGWDLAATPKDEDKARDPDYAAGVKIGKTREGMFYVMDVRRTRGTPQQVEGLVLRTAEADGRVFCAVAMEQEPGSSGKVVADYYRRRLAGFAFFAQRSTGSKVDRALPLAAQAEGGNVKLVRGAWNRDFLDELEVFPLGGHDDQCDAAAVAFNKLVARKRLVIG